MSNTSSPRSVEQMTEEMVKVLYALKEEQAATRVVLTSIQDTLEKYCLRLTVVEQQVNSLQLHQATCAAVKTECGKTKDRKWDVAKIVITAAIGSVLSGGTVAVFMLEILKKAVAKQ